VFENTSKNQDWDSVLTKLQFRIGLMTTLVLHQAITPTFYKKLALMCTTKWNCYKLRQQTARKDLRVFDVSLVWSLLRL